MTQENPITPPPELVGQWYDCATAVGPDYLQEIATRAAQWGSDQELEACCEWINSFQNKFVHAHDLRLVRRPKPPSLKEQALECLKNINDACESEGFSRSDDTDIIRRALESLPD
jgi:hypothetical protein